MERVISKDVFAQTTPTTPSGSDGPTQRRCLLLLPPASSIDVIAAPSLSAAIAIAITTLGRAMPRHQLTSCIRRGKTNKMSVFRHCMGLSHLAVGFRHCLQRGIALVGSASHSAAQTISQMVVIHAAFHGAGQVVQAASMFTRICVHLAHCVQSRSTFTRLYDHLLTRMLGRIYA